MAVHPWAGSTPNHEAPLIPASIVVDLLLDARIAAPHARNRQRIDALIGPLSHRELLTPDEVVETIAALDDLEQTEARRSRRLGRA